MKANTHRYLFGTSALMACLALPTYAFAAPQDGNVTGGNASIDVVGNTTTINQSSDRAIIRWQSFDVDSIETVKFNQPNSGSITVNRITDTKASRIEGKISANGNIILINPNGLVFGAGSVVDVGGMIATTSDLENDNAFMAGGAAKFTKPGNPDGRIINKGHMTVRDGGLVGLVAPNVENHGVIQAKLGKVILASGDIHTIDFAGDGLIKLEVSDDVTSQTVTNTGIINADGGQVLVTAAQARGMVDALITNTGTIRANTVRVNGVEKRGEITISTKGLDISIPRGNSMVFNTGRIEAQGMDLLDSGGIITILSDKINIGDGSYVTAAGDLNGGTIKIGGNYQGGNGLPTSNMIYVSGSAILNAESRRGIGDGGTIILWSDTNTRFYGHADVSGLDGGLIEVSSKGTIDIGGTFDMKGHGGEDGVLLLDPTDIVISNSANNNVGGASPFSPTVDNGPSVLNIATLQAALASGNVIVQTRATGVQTGSITVSNALAWTSGNTLTLDAHGAIIVNAAISAGTGSLTMLAGGDVTLAAAVSGSGTLTFEQAANTGTIGIGTGATGVLNLNATDLGNITDGWGNIVIGKTTSTAAMDVRANVWNDSLTLRSNTGVITFTGVTNVGANNLTIITGADVVMTAGNLTGQGDLTVQQYATTTTMGLAGGAGTVNFTAAEIGRITNGWNNLIFGRTDSTVALITSTVTWNDNLTLQNGSGTITVSGVQTLGTNNLTINTDGDITLSATNSLTGSGALVIYNNTASTTIGLGGTGTINLNATDISRIRDGWASITIGRTDGTGAINMGAGTWSDSLTVQTGSGQISTVGTVAMGGNTLVVRSDTKISLGASITGTATHNFITNANNISIGIGDGQTGTHNYTNADLAYLATTGTLVFGRSDSSADLNVGAYNWLASTVFQTGAGALNINGAQTMGAKNVTLRTDSNVNIGAAITSTGTFSLVQSSVGTTMGILDGQAGTIHLSTAENALLGSTWASRVLGRTDGTGEMNVGGATWVDPMTFRTGTGQLNINGATAMGGNNLAITTDSDLHIGGNLTGTQTLTIAQAGGTTMAVGTGQVGEVLIDDVERARIMNGWTLINLGSTTSTGGMNVGDASWADPLTLRSGTGVISINGVQSMAANALSITSDSDVSINAALTGTGTLAISGMAAATTVAVGDGQTGTMQLNTSDIANITNGWTTIAVGTTSQTGAMNIGATTWNDNVLFRTNSGVINVNDVINSGSSNISFSADSNLVINANLIGTGTLSIYGSSNATSVGVGTGQAGTVQISDAELAFIQDGWSTLIFGKTSMDGVLNIAGRGWTDSVQFRTESGALNINGIQDVSDNSFTIYTNTNLTLAHNIIGTGTLSIIGSSTGTTMGIGNGQSGTVNLNNTELAYIQDGWNQIIFGRTDGTGIINVGARTWTDSVDYRTTAVININGAQNMGANNLTIRSNANPVIGGALTGTGTLNIMNISTSSTVTMGIGDGQTGVVNLTNAELDLITDGWNMIVFGNSTQGSVMNIAARTWNDNVTFQTAGGVINVNGAQNMGANNLTFTTSGNLAINANVTGTGTLTIQSNALNTSMMIGSGGSGTINLIDAELARIVDGWGNIVFGRLDGTGAMDIRAATWNDNVTFRTGAGTMTVNGVQNAQANNMTFRTNSNIVLNADLIGTGNLVIRTASGTTGLAVGDGQTGTVALTNTELGRIINGWGNVTFGGATQLGAVNIGAYTWNDVTYFVAQGNLVINGTQTSTETSGTSLVFATTGGSFINNAGAAAINPGGGRYLVYSVDQGIDTLGGLVALNVVNPASYAGYGPASVVEVGNVFLYSGATAKIIYVQIDDIDKIYGEGLPAFTYTYLGGLQGSDILSDVIISTSFNAVGSSVFDSAGTTRTVTGAFGGALGYTVTVVDGTMTVIPATITVTVDSDTRVYGDADPTIGVTYTGFKNGDDETDIDTLAIVDALPGITANVGNYATTASGADDNNYVFNYVNGNISVTKATLTTTAQNTSRIYGDGNPTFTFAYSGFKNSDNATMIDTGASGASAANATSGVGTYAITGSGALDNNYNFNYVNGTLTVNKATLTATADNKSRVYGDANPALTVTYTGFKNGDTSSVINSAATASTGANATSGVNTYAIIAAGASDDNYDFTYVGGTLTVNKATLTATASNGARAYGDANPALTVSYSGFKNGETSSVINTGATASSAANATSGVGAYSTVASGASDDNYDFTYVNGTLTVNKATLTATASNGSRAYGDDNPALTVSYSGFKNGETSSVINTGATASSAANATSGVGTYSTVASGASDDNYDFTYVNGTLTVNKAMLTATASNGSRAYGDTNPALTVSYSGFKNGETSAVINTGATASSSAISTTGVGTYSTVASGASDDNYDFTYVDGVLTINKAILTATASNASREYGNANPALTVSYSGFKNGETFVVINTGATASSSVNATSNVGSYTTVASGASDDNYDFTYVNGALNVTKAMLTATASNGTRVYGDVNPTLTVSYTGFKNSETSAVINTGATASSSANAASNVGSYTTVASGASDNNYDFTYVDGTLNVTKAMLTATASNGSRVYGDANPALTVSYSGFKNSQNSSVIDTAATASSAAIATTGVGTYATTASGASDNNYDFTYVDGTLTISKATLTATASSGLREYGDSNPGLTVSYTGFKNGETSGVINTGATATTGATNTSNVGSYATTASGASDDNYSFTYINGALTVTKAMLTVNAGNGTRVYGDANPTIGVTYTGFKNGETSSVLGTQATGSSAANAISNVGTYSTASSGGSDNNYDFTHVGTGTLTVTKATLTASANSETRKQFENNPTFTVSYTGFKNGETSSVIDTQVSASTTATPSSAIGSYSITASGGLDNNYNFNYVNGTLTVLDPDYIPPPPSTGNTLPSTIQQNLTPPTQQQMVIAHNQSIYNASINSTTSLTGTLHQSPLSDKVVVITPDEDFDYLWSQDPFLIALTQTIEDYFELVHFQE